MRSGTPWTTVSAVNEYKDSLRLFRPMISFEHQVSHWLSSANGEEGQLRPWRWRRLLRSLLNMVVIDLHQRDDPNVIFETSECSRNAPATVGPHQELRSFAAPCRCKVARGVETHLDDAWWLRGSLVRVAF